MASQQHLDRLSAVDAGFLAQEKPNTHMHIGGLALFEGEPPELDEFLAHIESRLHLVPRYRQKLATPPLETGRPLWVDDPTFNLAYHVRHTRAASRRVTRSALLAMAARVFSQRLDRSKPLWELWLVEGRCEGERLRAALEDPPRARRRRLGRRPRQRAVRPHARGPRRRRRQRAVGAAARAVERRARRARADRRGAGGRRGRHRRARRGLASPGEALDRAREVATGIGEVAWTALNAPPDTPFNVAARPAPADPASCARASTSSSSSRTRSAPRSTTSCSRSSPARSPTSCSRAGAAPRGSS